MAEGDKRGDGDNALSNVPPKPGGEKPGDAPASTEHLHEAGPSSVNLGTDPALSSADPGVSPVARGGVKLRVIQGRPQGKSLLFARGEWLFGRGPECHVRPNSEWVSRQHCILKVTETAVFIRDLNSRNGTLVNGLRVVGERRLADRDQIQVGPLAFEVQLGPLPKTPAGKSFPVVLPAGGGNQDRLTTKNLPSLLEEGPSAGRPPGESLPALPPKNEDNPG
jgi:hypothetical protein